MSIKMNISPGHFEELVKKGYSLDMIYLLKLIKSEADISSLCERSERIKLVFTSLIRKNLVTESGDKVTTLGDEILEFMDTKLNSKLPKKEASPEFNKWWEAYPPTDSFVHRGQTFKGDRSLRKDRDNCRLKFEKILLEGDYTAEQLIDALKYEVLMKKDASVKFNTNKLKYMQNSLTYLNQRSYEAFIEQIKTENDLEQQIETGLKTYLGATDI